LKPTSEGKLNRFEPKAVVKKMQKYILKGYYKGYKYRDRYKANGKNRID